MSEPSPNKPKPTYHRKIIHIRATDSPNVKLGLEEQARGKPASGRIVLQGVLSWDEYQTRVATWDPIRQCIGLDAQFYEGAELLMFPTEWLNQAELAAEMLRGVPRVAEGIGIDSGEGEANTVWSAVDRYGLIEQISIKTRDTSVIIPQTIAFAQRHECPFDRVVFDRGGGGRQYADAMRVKGYQVRTVAFGEPIVMDAQRAKIRFTQKVRNKEDKYVYKNRRAQMFHALRLLIEPDEKELPDPNIPVTPNEVTIKSTKVTNPSVFALPARYVELRRQLAPIPLTYDEEGRVFLLPKHRKEGDSKEKRTLVDLIGCSPDEADSLVVAIYAMQYQPFRAKAGAL